MTKGLVSIITPVFNCEKYIAETIKSVQDQSYKEWELILIDDCSTDNSPDIIKSIARNDSRIVYLKQPINGGAAVARNAGLNFAKGQYIAYLDSDDLWKPEKLEKQVAFMTNNKFSFCCCNYEMIKDNGKVTKVVKVPKKSTYGKFLRTTLIHTSGIIGDVSLIDKSLFIMPNVRRGQDSATWAQVIKAGHPCYGLPETLHCYRQVGGSLSHDRMAAIKRTWYWYRKIEHLNFFYALFCFAGHSIHAIMKRI